MLDENRIKLMTRMASYEANEGKKQIPVASYFRGDYISFNVVKSAISATISFALIVAMYIYYNLESLISDVYKLDLVSVGRRLVYGYVAVVVVYSLLAYIVYTIRYDRAKKSLHSYYQALKRLSSMYDEEEME